MARFSSRNAILSALPKSLVEQLAEHLERVPLEQKKVLYDNGVPIEHVFFPESGLVSVVGTMRDGTAVEVATIGNEGMVGLPVVFGARQTTGQAFVQVPGQAVRLPADVFREVVRPDGPFRDAVDRYTRSLFALISQSAACNRLHPVEERFARWLLLCHDRLQSDAFPMTQQFLSQMLGVRRASVSEVASKFQQQGLIEYKHGIMTLCNRKGIEQAACECYEVIRHEFNQALPRTRADRTSPIPRFTSRDGKTTTTDGTPRTQHAEPALANRAREPTTEAKSARRTGTSANGPNGGRRV